jgi:Leucine-rich repeat (LRR) protein
MEEILPQLQSLTRLQTLDLSDMGLSGSIVLSSEMTDLKSLFLQRNRLTTLTVPASMTNLEVLHASDNTLTHVDLPMGMERLGTIDLSHNQLSSFSLPPNASAVKRMNFRANPLASLDIAASQNCLQDIDLSFTLVTNLVFLNGFEKLQTFGFFGNASARLVFPDGLRRLRVLLLHNYCYGGGCHWSGTENAFDTVELPASVNVAELITRGFPRDRIRIRGYWMHPPVVTSDGQFKVRINGASGRSVQVQSSTNLVDWANWQSVVLGTDGSELVDEPSTGPMRYYRLVQVPADER